jgi:hypothetical protein
MLCRACGNEMIAFEYCSDCNDMLQKPIEHKIMALCTLTIDHMIYKDTFPSDGVQPF